MDKIISWLSNYSPLFSQGSGSNCMVHPRKLMDPDILLTRANDSTKAVFDLWNEEVARVVGEFASS